MVFLAVGATAGCNARNCMPPTVARSADRVDLCAPPGEHMPVDDDLVRAMVAAVQKRGAELHTAGAAPYQFLALSGGGFYGAFGVGVLRGWSDSGTRPSFDVVTGVSTGGLMATFAFLGPKYDGILQEEFLAAARRDIMRPRSVVGIPLTASLYSSNQLARKIEKAISPQVFAEVAAAHAEGRRLYVGTANLDTRGLVMWDMGAIASRGTPQALELYRKIVLASASVPGVLPAVKLSVEMDGVCYDELHGDGASSDGAFFRPYMVGDRNRLAGINAALAPPGSTLHVIINGKAYSQTTCVRSIVDRFKAAADSVLSNKRRDELYRIFFNCLQTGVAYRQTELPRELDITAGILEVTPEQQQRLFEVGYRIGRGAPGGEGWRDFPPGIAPEDQVMPRTGTRFATRNGPLPVQETLPAKTP
jgi:hypothetical protein